jgi:hypothetical protein
MAAYRLWRLTLGMMVVLGAPTTIQAETPVVDYAPNPIETTPFGPAAADIVVTQSNFLPCYGGPISLCYYSGPKPHGKSQPDLSCDVTSEDGFANCRCIVIPYGPYWVDIHAILDQATYRETIEACGEGGNGCTEPNSAPVCNTINENQLFADAADPSPQTISTFSFALNPIPEFEIGQTNCDEALYAGCMTAPCVSTRDFIEICENSKGNKNCISRPISECACPTFTGPFQVGQDKAKCVLSKRQPPDKVWSAAYNPAQANTAPSPGCIPDAPGEGGCPLLAKVPGSDPPEPNIPAKPPSGVCDAVCQEYAGSAQNGVELGFTCDATLCTANGDPDLVESACSGLQNGSTSAILLLETKVGCSCCASQICECEPNSETDSQIRLLNEMQRQRFITPQCDLNGTLCGEP